MHEHGKYEFNDVSELLEALDLGDESGMLADRLEYGD